MTGTRLEAVAVDRRLKDGDTIALGGVALTAHHHPGHTKGATSFTLDVREGGRTYPVGIMNMGSINPGVTVRGCRYPTIGEDYARTFRAQKAVALDGCLGLTRQPVPDARTEVPSLGDPYKADRFVDSSGYRAAVDALEAAYNTEMAREGVAR